MSDASQGPGWWQASDGKWYPPEQQPGIAPPPQPGAPGAPGMVVPTKTHPLAIWSLVLGIISIVGICLCFPIAVISGIIAVVLGYRARKQMLDPLGPVPYGGAGLALAGIITGSIGIVLSVALGVLFVAHVSTTTT